MAPPPVAPSQAAPGAMRRLKAMLFDKSAAPSQGAQPPQGKGPEDILLDLAAQMEADGGMPGKTADARAGATLTALLAFLSQGHTMSSGAFRSHVTRLVQFLRALSGLSERHHRVTAEVLGKAGVGESVPGDWLRLAQKAGDPWKALEAL